METDSNKEPAQIRICQFLSFGFVATCVFLVFIASTHAKGMEMYRDISVAGLVPIIGAATALIPISFFIQRSIFYRLLGGQNHLALEPATLRSYFISLIVGHVLRELIAILGFVASILSADPSWATGFGVVAITLISLNWPSQLKLQSMLR